MRDSSSQGSRGLLDEVEVEDYYGKYKHYVRDCCMKKKMEDKTNYTEEKVDDLLIMAYNESNSKREIM
jgi:hypothetical protein